MTCSPIDAFCQAFDGMQGGFRRRAQAVTDLFQDPATRFVVVGTPRVDTVQEATYFVDRLAERGADPAAIVVNRAQPRFGRRTAASARSEAAGAGDPDAAVGTGRTWPSCWRSPTPRTGPRTI